MTEVRITKMAIVRRVRKSFRLLVRRHSTGAKYNHAQEAIDQHFGDLIEEA